MDPDDLYGLPLERFVPERTALAKALRADKRRDEATEVAALRKPSVAAWAVNQLVRTQHEAVTRLFDAGDALRDAQAGLLDGRGDAGTLRAAREQQRAAVEDLVGKARGLLTTEGYELSATVIERVGDTLHAAALDDDARAQVRDGRLERELRHVGLGLGEGMEAFAVASPARSRKGAASTAKQPSGGKGGGSAARAKQPKGAKREEAERARRERAAARTAARAAEATAKRRATAATSALNAAQTRCDDAERELREAEAALASAHEDAEAAAAALERAQAELEAL